MSAESAEFHCARHKHRARRSRSTGGSPAPMAKRILVTAAIYSDSEARKPLLDAGFELVDSPPDAPFGEDAIIGLLEGCDAVIADSDAYTERVFAACPQLRLVSRWGVGVDSIDREAATRHEVMVTNTPGIIRDAVADLALMFILALARRLREGDAMMRAGGWGKLVGANVGGATIGIIGMGDIGTCTARRAYGFGMRILAFDPQPRRHLVDDLGVEFVDLPTLLRESDFVTLHCNATEQNRNLIGSAELQLMKPTAFLINCARGSLVDEGALVEALQDGSIAGAGLDVYAQEPPDPGSPLFAMENCLFMPHTATMDYETIAQVSAQVTKSTLDALQGRRPEFLINPEVG